MGKKPFSAKAKREQLRQKRLAAASGPPLTRPSSKQPSSSLVSSAAASSSPPATSAPSVPTRHPRSRAPRGAHSHRFRLHLSDSDALTTKQQSDDSVIHLPLPPPSSLLPVHTAVHDIRPYPDPRFAMPCRPSWRYDDPLELVDRRERAALLSWREQVLSHAHNNPVPPFFEHNLETWRQLWRVIERSDVLILVVDIRFPALHFVPDLYHYVTDNLRKSIVLALNKADLVPFPVVLAWKNYFLQTYPRLSVAMFSSFPDANLDPCEHNSQLLSKRERRMARSKLSAWGADQLMHALNSLDIPATKKAYLHDWHTRMSPPRSHPPPNHSMSNASHHPPPPPANAPLKKKAARKRSRNHPLHPNLKHQPDLSNPPRAPDPTHRDSENMITIGVVGHPNAGKSSLINGIFQKKVVSTSKTPGHTKHLQTMFITDTVQLCDCPGLVFPGLAPRELQILAGMFPIAQVREPLSVVKYLAERVDIVKTLNLSTEIRKLEDFLLEDDYFKDGWTAWKICEAWAMKRGYRTAKAARLDVTRAANHILRLAVEGRIVLSTLPDGFKVENGNVASIMNADWSEDESESGDTDSEEDSLKSLEEGEAHSTEGQDVHSSASGEESQQEGDDEDDEDDEDDDSDSGAESVGRPTTVNAFALLGEEDE